MTKSWDAAICGGGAVGLSIAFRLAQRGLKVALFDQSEFGTEASWAGAGMLPPGFPGPPDDFVNQLCQKSSRIWPEWSGQIRELSGIDAEYQRCGAWEIPLSAESRDEEIAAWQTAGVQVSGTALTAGDVSHEQCHWGLAPDRSHAAFFLPDFAQVRNPRYLAGLLTACQKLGVSLFPRTPVTGLIRDKDRVTALQTSERTFHANNTIIAAGAWSSALAKQAGIEIDVRPLRGQMILLKSEPGRLTHVIEQGKRYIVPRRDGRVLIGSTEEDQGFVKANTAEGLADLREFAFALVPELAEAEVEKTWSGLRPFAPRGKPYVGPVEDCPNLLLATGHFRNGLQWSPLTALTIERYICATDVA